MIQEKWLPNSSILWNKILFHSILFCRITGNLFIDTTTATFFMELIKEEGRTKKAIITG